MNAQTLKALVSLLVTVLCTVANAAGYAMDFGVIYNVIFGIAALATVGWVWWKNQNVTPAAQAAQEFLDEMKRGNK